jgi:pyruvate dehydrogenase E1 component alpha subunit
LPAIFVCENNGYGMKTPVKMASASIHMFNRCNFLPGILVDGMDVLAVREAARWARKYCLEGNGPIVLELDTYRFVGHTVGEPGIGYRSQEEINEMRKARDPISHFREKIISEQLVHEDDIKAGKFVPILNGKLNFIFLDN